MSGKTTFLRTLGINAVLAQAGGPVCATTMTLTLLRLASAINIKDSLKAGESYFFVELLRLRDALASSTQDPRPLLCLLDEPLRGTNYQERMAVLRLTLKTLLDRGACVALTSHDPEMLKSPDLTPRLRLVHFCEQYEDGPQGPAMSFDYRLREGPSGPGNALKLLKILGMDQP
jgi:DNA mismatch repair ATPase MutS